MPVDLLPEADAEALFTAVSGRTDAGAVARLCGGLPLAIRIAAARLRDRPMWTTDDFARRLGGHRSPHATCAREATATTSSPWRERDWRPRERSAIRPR
ncbi:hypothetical protein ACFXGA_23000 [Actinosynnema sp. NPDC059335]|uniref:hypothetical protein n=1 Tax=Actinosynnema sp. NPDC059335 TaxID=3346804 RepID=UPI00366DB875